MVMRTVGAAIAALALAGIASTAAGQQGIALCVGADRVVRVAQAGACAAGETRLLVAPDQAADARVAQLSQQVQQLQQRVAQLERELAARSEADQAQIAELNQQVGQVRGQLAQTDQRIANLERARPDQSPGPANRVTAPFEVVDQEGNPIFRVREDPRGFALMVPSGEIVAVSSALPTGGFFKALSADQSRVVITAVNGDNAFVAVREGDEPRGTLTLLGDGKPYLVLTNDNGTEILALTQGESGGGYIQLTDASGTPTLEAGTTAAGVGVVRAGPTYNCSGKMGLIAPDCIVGRK